jgi:hypothetical protein
LPGGYSSLRDLWSVIWQQIQSAMRPATVAGAGRKE